MSSSPLAALSIVVALSGAAPSAQTAVEARLARAMDLHTQGDVLGAVDGYLAVLAEDPSRIDALANLGAAYAQLGRFEEAVERYREAIAGAGPRATPIRFNLGLALYKGGNPAAAVPEFEQVLAAEPANTQAALLLADCYRQTGEPAKVVALLSPREPSFAGDTTFAFLYGQALIEAGDARGEAVIDRIFRDASSAEAHFLFGLAHFDAREFPESVKAFAEAARLKPDLPSVHAMYGKAVLATGDPAGAVEAFRRELQQDPNSFEANLYLGTLARNERRHEEALLHLTRAHRMRPADPNVRYGLAGVHLNEGRAEEARELLEDVVRTHPKMVEAHVLLATAYYRLKRREEGDRQREIVLQLTAERQAAQPGSEHTGIPALEGDAPEHPRQPPAHPQEQP